MKNTKKKYKTLKDFLKPFAIGFTSLSILGGIVKYLDAALHMGRSESGMPLVTILLVSLVVIIFDLYCFSRIDLVFTDQGIHSEERLVQYTDLPKFIVSPTELDVACLLFNKDGEIDFNEFVQMMKTI